MTTAVDFLNKAAQIMQERGKQYDKPEGERSMGKCVDAFNIITGRDLTEAEGWLLLQILKDVRQWQRPGYHQDSAEDCVAYAALKAEAKEQEVLQQNKNADSISEAIKSLEKSRVFRGPAVAVGGYTVRQQNAKFTLDTLTK